MPVADAHDARRGRLLHSLYWGGIGLSPLALLILLFGQSAGSLRVAVILAVLTIVMLAVSISLRPSVDLLRVDIEERVFDEVEHVRAQTREDMTTAARNTHRALSEKIHALAETVEALRVQLEQVQAVPVLAEPAVAHVVRAQAAGPGVVRRTETVHVTRRTTTVDAGDDDSRGTVYGTKSAVEGEWRPRPEEQHDRGWHGDNRERGSSGHRAARRRPDEHDSGRVDPRRDGRWDSMTVGGRWASVSADDQSRELRVGERRSSMHSDQHGTEFRVEDRWAALRREESYRGGSRYGDAGSGWESVYPSVSGGHGAAAALPPATGEPASRYLDAREGHDRESGRSRGWERGREPERQHEPDRHRASERHHEAERHHEPARQREPERDWAEEPDRGWAAERSGSHGRGWEADHGRDRGRGRDTERSYERGHEPDSRADWGHAWEHSGGRRREDDRESTGRHGGDRQHGDGIRGEWDSGARDHGHSGHGYRDYGHREHSGGAGRDYDRDPGHDRGRDWERAYDRGREDHSYSPPRPRSAPPPEYDR